MAFCDHSFFCFGLSKKKSNILFFNSIFFTFIPFCLKISNTWHVTPSVISAFKKLGRLSELPVLLSGPAVNDLLLRRQDHTRTYHETSSLYCIFCATNIYLLLPSFCIVIIDLNIFWVVFKLFLIKIKYPKMSFFFNDFKINWEHVEILMKFLVFYSLMNYSYDE